MSAIARSKEVGIVGAALLVAGVLILVIGLLGAGPPGVAEAQYPPASFADGVSPIADPPPSFAGDVDPANVTLPSTGTAGIASGQGGAGMDMGPVILGIAFAAMGTLMLAGYAGSHWLERRKRPSA